jgi:hypothetical protein
MREFVDELHQSQPGRDPIALGGIAFDTKAPTATHFGHGILTKMHMHAVHNRAAQFFRVGSPIRRYPCADHNLRCGRQRRRKFGPRGVIWQFCQQVHS